MPPGERAQLSVTDATLLVIGSMVGTGIFLTTGGVAEALPCGWMILAAWVIGGVFALCGSLTFAELGAMLPRAGGHYVYIREAYGDLAGFLDGWVSFLVAFPCSIAFMAVGVSRYLAHYCPFFTDTNILARIVLPWCELTLNGSHIPALLAVVALTLINCMGLRTGSATENALTVLKVVCLLGLPLIAFALFKGDWSNFTQCSAGRSPEMLRGMAGALIGISFAYRGWDAPTYMSHEIDKPRRVLPRSLVMGTAMVAVIYLVFNAGLLYVLPMERLAGSANAARDAALMLMGEAGGSVVAAVIIVSILGAMHATVMVGPRIYYAMARDGLFFKTLGRLHPRSNVPVAAIAAQGVWTCAIMLTGTFSGILTYTVFAILVLSTATAAAVFVLRARRPGESRPYRTLGYPVVPALYCLGSLAIMVNAVVSNPAGCAYGLVALAAGIPAFLFWRRKRGRPTMNQT